MNPLLTAAVWAGAGAAGSLLLPRLRARRLAILVPIAGLCAVIIAGVGTTLRTTPLGGDVSLSGLDRAGEGLMVAAAASMAAALGLSPSVAGSEAFTIGLVGASVVIALATDSPTVWALGLLTAIAVLALRWVTAAPGRATLAIGRVAGGGAAVLLAAGAFLPLTGFTAGPRPILVAVLLASGVSALLALVPVGGWAVAGYRALRGIDVAVWQLLVAPAVLLSVARISFALPDPAAVVFGRIVLVMGLVTALWSAFHSCMAPAGTRYGRFVIADFALAAAAVAGSRSDIAVTGALVIVLTHLVLGPVLLSISEGGYLPYQRAAWALLCGLPPAPSFWGRFLALEGLAQVTLQSVIPGFAVLILMFLASIVASLPGAAGSQTTAQPRKLVSDGLGWVLVATAIALGLVPQAAATFVFGAR